MDVFDYEATGCSAGLHCEMSVGSDKGNKRPRELINIRRPPLLATGGGA